MIGRIEFNFQNGTTRYFDENNAEIDAGMAQQLIAEREQFLAEQAANPSVGEPLPAYEPSEG